MSEDHQGPLLDGQRYGVIERPSLVLVYIRAGMTRSDFDARVGTYPAGKFGMAVPALRSVYIYRA